MDSTGQALATVSCVTDPRLGGNSCVLSVMGDNDIEFLNNPYGLWGPVRDDDNDSGDGSDAEEYDYSFYDSADMTPRNNQENYDMEDRVASDNEAHQTDKESYNDDDEENEEDDQDDDATQYTNASVNKRMVLGLSPNGKPFCFLCSGEHCAPQCDTYPGEKVRSRQCSCGLFHTEALCSADDSDDDD